MKISKEYTKQFNKLKMRKINVFGQTFLWKRMHIHLEEFEYSQCVEKVKIYLEGYKNSPLILFFRGEDNHLLETLKGEERWEIGYPESGIIWKYIPDREPTIQESINLNSSPVIVKLIKYYYHNQWFPESENKPYIDENSLTLTEKIEFNLLLWQPKKNSKN